MFLKIHVVALGFLSLSLSPSWASKLTIFGEWLPYSTTAISITGPIVVTSNSLIVDDKIKLTLSNPQHIAAYGALEGVVEATEFTVKGRSNIAVIRGNILCRPLAKRVIFWLDSQNRLGMVLLDKEKPAMTYDYTGCGGYKYFRKPEQNIS